MQRVVYIASAEGGFIINAHWKPPGRPFGQQGERTIVATSPAAAARHVSALLKEPAPVETVENLVGQEIFKRVRADQDELEQAIYNDASKPLGVVENVQRPGNGGEPLMESLAADELR